MSRRALTIAALATSLALLALLGYSLERTAWVFERFETKWELAYAAAVVVELAAVALIAGASAIAGLDHAARAWANRALLAVLSTQALANLAAGYLRGGQATLALFGPASDMAAYAVASTLWLVVNLSVPALVLCLSKLLERLIASLAMLRSRPDVRPQRRALIRRLIDRLRTTRDQLAQSQAAAAQLATDLAHLRAAAAQPDPLLAQQASEIGQLREQIAQQEQTAAQQARMHANSAREADRQIAQLQELAAQPLAIDGIDLLAIARRLRSGGASSRETAQLIGLPESTLRSRLDKAAQNGHVVEV